ncbi:MAG: fumarylacetoacetate hydrolase family protein [Pseudomonadota bacterium]
MNEAHRRACELIWELWQNGNVTEGLPAELRPGTRAEAYAIQSGFETFSSKPRYGWKIAATSKAGQTHIGVDGPLAGRILAERVAGDGDMVSISDNRMSVVEPEFAFRLAHSLGPRDTTYEADEVLEAAADLHLCLELPDSRFTDFAGVGGPCLIADNACARDLVVGRAVTADWRDIDLAGHSVTATVGRRYTREGNGRNVLGDPGIALAWLVNEVTALGLTLDEGELITTGTCAVPLEVEAGDRVRADFGILGTVSVHISG